MAAELGLGNGRTYDHLRTRLPDWRVVVFERNPQPNEKSWPPECDLYVGDIQHTATMFAADHGPCASLVHADLGDGSETYNEELQQWLPGVCHALAAGDGWVISSTPLAHRKLELFEWTDLGKLSHYSVYRASR